MWAINIRAKESIVAFDLEENLTTYQYMWAINIRAKESM